MSVSNGQPADQNTFNNAFVSKTANSTVTGQITLSNGASGSSVSNVQLEINNIKSSVATAESDIDQLQIDVPAVEAKIDNHIVDAIDAHTASAITNIPDGNLAATNVQAALDELQTDIDTRATSTQLSLHVNAFTEAHDAFAISFLAGGTIDSTDVQNAIEEVATDAASDLSTHASTTTSVHGIADTADLLTTSNTKVVTNKDIDGGTASNTNRITLPKATKATLEGLTRKQATIVYASDENKVYADDGTNLIELGGGGGAFTSISARYSTNAGQVIPSSGAITIINFEDQSFDTNNLVTIGPSWKWTSDRSGYVSVSVRIMYAVTNLTTDFVLFLYKNNTFYSELDRKTSKEVGTSSNIVALQGFDLVNVFANDYLDIRTSQGSASTIALIGNSDDNYVSMRLV